MRQNLIKLLLGSGILFSLLTSCEKDEMTGDFQVQDTTLKTAGSYEDHDDPQDYIWNSSDVIYVTLNGSSISTSSSNVTVSGSTATITAGGTYSFSGSLSDGRIIVNSADAEIVRLILNGVNLYCGSNAPIFVEQAEKTIIILADYTTSYITDGSTYVFEEGEDEPNAAIFSKDNLTIYGNGSLVLDANYADGIASKDGLVVKSGNISVNAVDDGIRGKDYLTIKGGTLNLTTTGDGLKSTNEDEGMGYIVVEYGNITINSQADAIQAITEVEIIDGIFDLTSADKGIVSDYYLTINSGTFDITSTDDGIHSNQDIEIYGGSILINAGDDAIHADSIITIHGGTIDITNSYEGIEAATITINAGNMHVVSSDDGINASDGSGDMFFPGVGGNCMLYINGGYIYVDGNGDGIDVNGSIVMTAGQVIVNGPTEQMNGAIDYDGTFNISGGFIVAAGSAGMPQTGSTSSSQYCILANLTTAQQAGTIVNIQNSSGQSILTFAPSKQYQSIAFSSPDLAYGTSYNLYTGGSSSGTVSDGLYTNGTYSPGTLAATFTVSSIVTNIGSTGGFPTPPGGGPGGGWR